MKQYLKVVKAGEIIMATGDHGDSAYLINTGQVEVFIPLNDNQDRHLGILGEGEVFGEMAIIDDAPRSASVRALVDSELIIIHRNQIADRVSESEPLVRFLIASLLKRLRSADLSEAIAEHSPLYSNQELATEDHKAIETLKIEADLRQALAQEQLQLYYQPIYATASHSIAGFEALSRWFKPDGNLVPTGLFMEVAEQTALILPLGTWVVETAVRDLAKLRKSSAEYATCFMSINVSCRQLMDDDFLPHLIATCQRYHLAPAAIKVEITERIFMAGAEAVDRLKTLREQGFKVALDDFGTGYSSLCYLKDIAIDTLKIDRSFIKDLPDPRSQSLNTGLISLSHDLGISVVAEGIEEQPQYDWLTEQGCDYIQGYLKGRPQPLDNLL